jgi:predicted TIM-barrel fold metal-dependent hydrolase
MKIGRFVVDCHNHTTTLYRPAPEIKDKDWRGMYPTIVEPYDNSDMMLYDMDCYGVDMAIILPSFTGTRNEVAAAIVDKYPNRFRACCEDTTLRIKCARGEVEWTIEAALEEIEAALKTGKFVGIGEFAPGGMGVVRKPPTFRQRLDEFRAIAELAAKYDVVLDFHEYTLFTEDCGGLHNGYRLISKIAEEFPDVPIIILHAGVGPGGRGVDVWELQQACNIAAWHDNVYLETGYLRAELYEVPLKDPNIGATKLIWGGGDTGSSVWSKHPTFPGAKIRNAQGIGPQRYWPSPLPYQTDFYGWAIHQIHRLKDLDLATQDEINLIVGGNAAKIFKLPVPRDRMFACGRPDLSGIYWEETIPFLPKEQIQNPVEYEREGKERVYKRKVKSNKGINV